MPLLPQLMVLPDHVPISLSVAPASLQDQALDTFLDQNPLLSLQAPSATLKQLLIPPSLVEPSKPSPHTHTHTLTHIHTDTHLNSLDYIKTN